MSRPRSAAMHRIDPFDLRLFAAIVEAGSITAGARRIHKTTDRETVWI